MNEKNKIRGRNQSERKKMEEGERANEKWWEKKAELMK